MVFAFFLAIIYFLVLFFFGWQLVRYFLKENRIEYLIGLSGILGIGLYIFFINAIGYFIPIKIVFYLVLSLFLVLGLVLFYFNKSKSLECGIDKKWRKILLVTTLLLVVTSGIISFRFPLTLHSPGGLPVAAIIAEGGFPPVEIWYPQNSLNYHYAPDLFSAAIHKITGLPLYLAFDFQVAILVGIMFLLGFAFVKRFFDNNFKAFISSLLMIYAGSIVFLKGIKGIPILYNLYIRHQEISAPFKFVSDAIDSEFFVPVLKNMVGFTWGAMTFPLIIAIIYLYFHLISQKASKITFLFCGLLLAVLALFAETYFVLLSLFLLVYPFIFGFIGKDWGKSKDFLRVSFWVLIIALPLAFLQGGVLTGVLDVVVVNVAGFADGGGGFFKVNEVPWLLDYFQDERSEKLLIFNSKFLIELGLLLAVLIPAFIFLLKRNLQLGSFLGALLAISFFIPIFITTNNFAFIAETFHFFVRCGEMWRFFYLINLIGGLVVGLFLGSWYLSVKKRWFKRAIIFLIVILMAQGLLFQLLFLSVGYPSGTWNPADEIYAQPGSFEEKSYDWVKKNTTVNDLFLIIEKDCDYDQSVAPHHWFIINTNRMAPIYAYHCSYPEIDSIRKIKENCDPLAIKDLQYSYLYVNEDWPQGLEEKCLANNDLELKFETRKGNKFVRIYKNLALPEP